MEEQLTTAEVAAELRVTPQAVSLMVKRGALTPARKLPGLRGAFLFDRASVEANKGDKS